VELKGREDVEVRRSRHACLVDAEEERTERRNGSVIMTSAGILGGLMREVEEGEVRWEDRCRLYDAIFESRGEMPRVGKSTRAHPRSGSG
jgi:hypothetical protein